MRRTSSISVSGVQVSGWSSITRAHQRAAERAAVLDDRQDHLAKGQHADQVAVSMTTSEPMSFSAMVFTASASGSSGGRCTACRP